MDVKSKRFMIVVFGLAILLAFSTVATMSQEDGGSCSALLELALQEMGDACGDMNRNSACYGYKLVSATFAEEQSEDYFTNPADRTELGLLETIKTAALNTATDQWGVAVLNVQANIPNTLPGQAVTFVLLGDVEVENAVEPEDGFVPADPLPVTTLGAANVRSGPGLKYNVIGSVSADTEFQADGFSEDGEWMRIVYGSVPAWIYRNLVTSDVELDGLPVLSPGVRMPMQAFYLRTGIGEAECEEAPADSLMIQGPKNLTVDLTVNGADITLGSTVLIRILPPGNIMEITVIDGHLEIDGITVYPGWKTTVCLSEPGNRGVDGESNDRVVSCGASAPVPIDAEDIAGWCLLGDMPEMPINYPVPINCADGVERPYVPPPVNPPNVGPTGVDCSPLAIGDPSGGMETHTSAFFWWNGIEQATSYKVIVYDDAGNVVSIHEAGSTETSATVGVFAKGHSYTWNLEAYQDGELICSAGTGSFYVVSDPPPPPKPLSASWSCHSLFADTVVVSWSNADPNDTLYIELKDLFGQTYAATGSGASGSVNIPINWYDIVFGEIKGSPSGDHVILPGPPPYCYMG